MSETVQSVVAEIEAELNQQVKIECQVLANGIAALKTEVFTQPVYYRTLASTDSSLALPPGFTIWADEWKIKKSIILSRLHSLSGSTTRVFGRNTKVLRIHQPEADVFLDQNHLKGSAKGKYKLALQWKGKLVAVAVFSKGLTVERQGQQLESFQLIRHCNLLNHTVVGGLSKLLKHFIELVKPDDIMTYAESGLSDGDVFEKLGFKKVDHTDVIYLRWDATKQQRVFATRLEREQSGKEELEKKYPFQLPGNQKYLLLLNKKK